MPQGLSEVPRGRGLLGAVVVSIRKRVLFESSGRTIYHRTISAGAAVATGRKWRRDRPDGNLRIRLQ